MRIFLAKYEPERLGGGWSFMRNFAKGMRESISTDYQSADIYFVASPSMVQREEVLQAKSDGKKIVLRIDNAVRNSRNRNTGMTRMKDFAEWADLVVYQSEWARDYLMPFTKKHGSVILNSVDEDIFYRPSTQRLGYENQYIYSRYNRDETKNWEVARYYYSQEQLKNKEARLHIVGQYSQELVDGFFDFYMDESYTYHGLLSAEDMGKLYRESKYFIYTYFNDACSNTLIEALVSGCRIKGANHYRQSGGASDIIKAFRQYGSDYFKLERMCNEYKGVMNEL